MLPLGAIVDLRAMALKEHPAFPKASALLKLHHQIKQSDGEALHPRHSLGESYPSAEMQSVYSSALAGWAIVDLKIPVNS